MDREMMLYQARQDFIDMHKDLFEGKYISTEHYDRIARDIQTMDALHFELMLEFTEKTDNIPVTIMWQQVKKYMEGVKKQGNWRLHKEDLLMWKQGELMIYKAHQNDGEDDPTR